MATSSRPATSPHQADKTMIETARRRARRSGGGIDKAVPVSSAAVFVFVIIVVLVTV